MINGRIKIMIFYHQVKYPQAQNCRSIIYKAGDQPPVFLDFNATTKLLNSFLEEGFTDVGEQLYEDFANYFPDNQVLIVNRATDHEKNLSIFDIHTESNFMNENLNPILLKDIMSVWVMDDENPRECPYTEDQMLVLLSTFLVGLLSPEQMTEVFDIKPEEIGITFEVLELLAECYIDSAEITD